MSNSMRFAVRIDCTLWVQQFYPAYLDHCWCGGFQNLSVRHWLTSCGEPIDNTCWLSVLPVLSEKPFHLYQSKGPQFCICKDSCACDRYFSDAVLPPCFAFPSHCSSGTGHGYRVVRRVSHRVSHRSIPYLHCYIR